MTPFDADHLRTALDQTLIAKSRTPSTSYRIRPIGFDPRSPLHQLAGEPVTSRTANLDAAGHGWGEGNGMD